jgi:hypothetical protein
LWQPAGGGGCIWTHAPFFLPLFPQGGEGRGEEPMFTSTNPAPHPSPRLGGEREFVVLSGCVHSSVCFVVSNFLFRFNTSRFGQIG